MVRFYNGDAERRFKGIGLQIQRDIVTNQPNYHTIRNIHIGKKVIQNKKECHALVSLLCDHAPGLTELCLYDTSIKLGLRAAKTLTMRGLNFLDSIQLVTWLHGLPPTSVGGFLSLLRDSPRQTVRVCVCVRVLHERVCVFVCVREKNKRKESVLGLNPKS